MEAGAVEQITRSMRAIEAAFLVGVDGVTEIWLVRHGDCYDGLTEGEDPPLSPLGRDQAERLAARVRRVGAAAVYSSPFRRALETATAITSKVEVDERLREIGLAWEPAADPTGVAESSLNRYVDFNEPPDEVIARMRAVLGEAGARHRGERIVMVSHGGAIIACLCDVMRLQFGALRLLPLYTSVSVIRIKGERRMVGSLADLSHLEPDMTSAR
jgi:2,3-bisphosphoglycerate-dependent phosphoglycerate mutase